jgi:hypothetical protein
MRIGEPHAGRRQSIQVRRSHLRLSVIAANIAIPEIIYEYDKDIGLCWYRELSINDFPQ